MKLNYGRRVANKPMVMRFAKKQKAKTLDIATNCVVTPPSGSGWRENIRLESDPPTVAPNTASFVIKGRLVAND